MPIILDQRLAQPPLPARVTSADGRLTAWLDEDHAGVLLRYASDQHDDSDNTDGGSGEHGRLTAVRFDRGRGDEQAPVRSGGVALAPGGTGFAYDAEPGLGAACLYQAIPIHADGHEGQPSRLALAAAGGLEPNGLPAVWLTSTTDADRTQAVLVKELPELDYDIESDSAAVLGSAQPVVVSAPTAAPTFDVTLISSSQHELHALGRLLRLPGHGLDGFPPPVVLLRWEQSAYQRADVFAAVTKVTEQVPAHARAVTRELALTMASVARPDPAGAALRLPEYSYAELAGWPTYASLAAGVSYAALLLRQEQ